MTRLYVLYDGRCGLCRMARQWLDRQEKLVELEFLPAGSFQATRMFPTLSDADRPEELIVVSEEGGVYRGGNAWIMCLYALEDYREWAERLSSPALLPLARQAFAMLSKQRGRISRWLGLASEHEIVEALQRVAAPACELPRPGSSLANFMRPVADSSTTVVVERPHLSGTPTRPFP